MKCENCGNHIPDFPEEKVERNKLDQVVSHKHGDTEGVVLSTKDFYCDPKCFLESHKEEVETA